MNKVIESLEAWKELSDFDELCTIVNDLLNEERQLGRDEAIKEIRKIHPEI